MRVRVATIGHHLLAGLSAIRARPRRWRLRRSDCVRRYCLRGISDLSCRWC